VAARLGNVIYWLGVVIAIPAGLGAAFMLFLWYMEPVPEVARWELIFFLYLAGISFGRWLMGRLALYILAGR
jgi:hypothetical protein